MSPDCERHDRSVSLDGRSEACKWFRDLALAVIASVVLVQFYCPRRVVGSSMMPTIKEGDQFFSCDLACSGKSMRRGDIVVFAANRHENFVKRIIGLPGETVRVESGRVAINGIRLDESYTYFDPDFPPGAWPQGEYQNLKLGDDEYFVMGDNRGYSNDGRFLGPIDKTRIYGRLAFYYWPPEKMFKGPAEVSY